MQVGTYKTTFISAPFTILNFPFSVPLTTRIATKNCAHDKLYTVCYLRKPFTTVFGLIKALLLAIIV